MTNKICHALTLTFIASILCTATPRAWAQDSAQKSASQPNNTAEKSGKEQGTNEKSCYPFCSTDASAEFPQANGPVELQSIADKRITLKLADSSRAVYEAIGKQAGISVLFDPDYVPRTVNVDLNDVSLQDALKIVAFDSRTFWRPVTPSSIFVAADTRPKRKEFEQQVVKTFYLPNLSQPIDFQDIVNTMRTVFEIDRVQMFTSHNTITVRGTPDQMILVEKLIDDVNEAKKKAGEYRLEFKINELANEKKLNSWAYVLIIEPNQLGKLRIGARVPIATTEKDKTTQYSYLELGKNIDCQVTSESEHGVGLRISVELSDLGPSKRTAPGRVAEVRLGDPAIPLLRMDTNATVELDKPTIVGTLDNPLSNHTFQIEVTATRAKEMKE